MIKWSNSHIFSVSEFRIYYASGAVFRGNINSNVWESCPIEGVQVVVLIYDKSYYTWIEGKKVQRYYREVISGADWYWFDSSSKTFGTADSLPEIPNSAVAKAGSTCENFFDIYNNALLEAD